MSEEQKMDNALKAERDFLVLVVAAMCFGASMGADDAELRTASKWANRAFSAAETFADVAYERGYDPLAILRKAGGL